MKHIGQDDGLSILMRQGLVGHAYTKLVVRFAIREQNQSSSREISFSMFIRDYKSAVGPRVSTPA